MSSQLRLSDRLALRVLGRVRRVSAWWGVVDHPYDRSEDGRPYAQSHFTPFGGVRERTLAESRLREMGAETA